MRSLGERHFVVVDLAEMLATMLGQGGDRRADRDQPTHAGKPSLVANGTTTASAGLV